MFTLDELQGYASDPRLLPLIGKTIIVGLWQYFEGELQSQDQAYGEIIGFEKSLQIQTTNGKRYYFPVVYEAIIPSPRGKYILKTTGQEISNPDFLLSWRVDLVDPIQESTWLVNSAPHIYSIVEKEWDFEEFHDQDYNNYLAETRGNEFIGKTILIGIRRYKIENGDNKFDGQTQKFGVITQLNSTKGFVIQLRDNSIYKLPPEIAMIQRAPEGEYELQSSGEIIVNPDFITQWSVVSK